MINQVPELHDGGYWYAVEAIQEPQIGGWTFGIANASGWYAEVNGVMQVVVRSVTPSSELGRKQNARPAERLSQAGITGKPFGRIEGR